MRGLSVADKSHFLEESKLWDICYLSAHKIRNGKEMRLCILATQSTANVVCLSLTIPTCRRNRGHKTLDMYAHINRGDVSPSRIEFRTEEFQSGTRWQNKTWLNVNKKNYTITTRAVVNCCSNIGILFQVTINVFSCFLQVLVSVEIWRVEPFRRLPR